MKLKILSTNINFASLNRTVFHKPFNPRTNLALEDPLLLSSHPSIQKEGFNYMKYFCACSPISPKAPEFLEKKLSIEKIFSEKIHMERSVILPYIENPLAVIKKAFLSTQQVFIPDSMTSPFPSHQTTYFSHKHLSSLQSLLTDYKSDCTPIVYLPKICPLNGKIDLSLLETIKEIHPFFLIVEDSHSFGLEGLNGFLGISDHAQIDLLITHTPKAFGKMLTIFSGTYDLLDTLFEHSLSKDMLFPLPTYLGMLEASLHILESLHDRRTSIKSFITKLKHQFPEDIFLYSPLITFHLHSTEEKTFFTKSLVDKGFLLPSGAFTKEPIHLTFHLNHLLEETTIHSIYDIRQSFSNQSICESI